MCWKPWPIQWGCRVIGDRTGRARRSCIPFGRGHIVLPNINAVLAGSRLKVKYLRQPLVHGIDLGMAEGRLHLLGLRFSTAPFQTCL